MSSCSDRTVPGILLDRWVEELTKVTEIMEVLIRSTQYTEIEYGGDRKTRIAMGEAELIRLLRDRLTDLFVEIEEVKGGRLESKD